MNVKIAKSGNNGDKDRSDCHVTLELNGVNGIEIDLKSKVSVMYGDSIIELTKKSMAFFGITNAKIIIDDKGALPWVMMARIESAVKQLVETSKELLPVFLPENKYSTKKDQYRFSRLYLPGNTPSLMINAGLHYPNGIILDLEDAVAVDKKPEARLVVRNALRALDFYGAERMVRINQIPKGIEDLDFIVPHNVNLILVPKCESAEQIHLLNHKLEEIKKKHNLSNPIWLMPIIESTLGVVKAYEIASAAENVVSLAIGLEDYTADLGTQRTTEATESFLARSTVVNAAKAAGIQAIDSVFSDVGDMEGLKLTVIKSKSMGFDGMGCIHPRQIKVIHENFAPSPEEIAKAKKIVNAFIEATEKGLGVVSLGTKMIDPPVVKRAQRSIDLAVNMGLIPLNWREELITQ